MTDYSRLLDAETKAFVERSESFYPNDDGAAATIADHRAVYDRMCRAFHAGYPDGVTTEDAAIEADTRRIPVRRYRSATPDEAALVLYFHGGGFMLGGLESHDDVCAELCGRTGFEVISVDYRLAPEHPHPAQFEDAFAAFEWAARGDGRPILLCGDSAGGNLAAAVAHAARGNPLSPVGQVLIYPVLGADTTKRSHVEHAQAPMLTVRGMKAYDAARTGGADFSRDPTFAPLSDADFSRLPPTFIVSAECDPLSSDGEAYRDAILAAGGRAVWFNEAGLVHGYLRARHSVGRARTSFSRIVEAVGELGRGHWPY